MKEVMRAKIAANIVKYGQHVVCVYAEENGPSDFRPFAYTIGNHGKGLPELLFIGSNDEWMVNILNILGQVQRDRGVGLSHGENVDYTARFPVRIMDAGQVGRDEYAVQAGVFYETENFDVRQILLPDQNGRYPGDLDCLPPYSEQIVLLVAH